MVLRLHNVAGSPRTDTGRRAAADSWNTSQPDGVELPLRLAYFALAEMIASATFLGASV